MQMLVDTGSDHTIVSAKVVKRAKMDPQCKVPVLCVHGDVCSYPTAEVELVSGDWKKKTRVVVAPNLPVAVLLGRDTYQESLVDNSESAEGVGLMAATRSLARKAEKETKERENIMTELPYPLYEEESPNHDEGNSSEGMSEEHHNEVMGEEKVDKVVEDDMTRGKDPGGEVDVKGQLCNTYP